MQRGVVSSFVQCRIAAAKCRPKIGGAALKTCALVVEYPASGAAFCSPATGFFLYSQNNSRNNTVIWEETDHDPL
ncbi:hypothetical protein AB9K35_13535 [Leisingera sp. XS_AS12]|jgi:hypothetical protein|uniref:hypothetical protein n=1 Tax=Leisingera sp. TaxID=1879318 RepID=UPI001C94129F|nr:hypothetical protein [Nocardioides marinus]